MWSLRYGKRHSKKELTFFQFLLRLFQLAYKIMQANSSGLEFITTISKFRKRKFLHRLVTSSLEYKIRHFNVVVEKERQKMYKKAWCCFDYSTYRFFDIFVLVAIVAMCVLSLSCFLGLPILAFRHVTRRSCSSTKQYNSPPPRPTPLNLYKKSYVARGDNRWICSCHPTWPHERQRTIKLRSKGKAKAQGAVYVSKMLRPTFPYQRYLAPFMMVNRPARGLQLKKTNKQTIKHLAQINGPQKALTKESAGAGLNGPTQRKETAKWRKNWKDA